MDTRTGAVRILRYVSASDVGKAINPKSVEGQDEGAAMQGMGHTLFEELVYEDGQLLNANLVDYRVPTFDEAPEVFETILIENEDGPGRMAPRGWGVRHHRRCAGGGQCHLSSDGGPHTDGPPDPGAGLAGASGSRRRQRGLGRGRRAASAPPEPDLLPASCQIPC